MLSHFFQQIFFFKKRLVFRLGRVSDVGEVVEVEPVGGFVAVEVVGPVADAVLLIECGLVGADEGDAPAVGVAHVEDLAVELLVGVEAEGSARAVECECHVGELFPALRLKKRNNKNETYINHDLLKET